MKNIFSVALDIYVPSNEIMKSEVILKSFKKHKREDNFYSSIERLTEKLKSLLLKSTNDDDW